MSSDSPNEQDELLNTGLALSYSDTANHATNLLTEYTNEYIVNNADLHQQSTRCVSASKFIFQCLAVVVGGCAGLPWISVGRDAGHLVDSKFVSFMAAYGGLITYGVTSIWAFYEVLRFLDKKTPQEQKLYEKYVRKKNSKILLSQIVGIISSLPTVYTANQYNNNKVYVIIAGLVSYAFNSLGMYKLIQYVSNAKQPSFSRDKKTFLRKINEKIQSLERQETRLVVPENQSEFYQSIVGDSYILDEQNSKSRSRYVCLFIFPLSNLMFNSVLTYRGLREIGFAPAWSVICNPIVTLPLYGLDLFSTNRAVDLIEKLYKSAKCHAQHKKPNLPIWRYIVIVVALFISIFSASPGAYIAYDQMSSTFFGGAAAFFGFTFWLLRLTLETNAVNEVTLKTKCAVGNRCNPRLKDTLLWSERLCRLRDMIEVVPNNVFDEYGATLVRL